MLDETIEQSRSMLTDTSVLRGKLEGEINVLKEQIKSAKSNEEHFQTRKASVQKEMDAKLLDKEGILADKRVIDEQVAEIERERNEAREKLLTVQSRIEELNNDIEAGKKAGKYVKNKLNKLWDNFTQ